MEKLSNIRIGRVTSSEISALTSNGKAKGEPGAPFFTYVEECRMERFFKQKLENDIEVKAFSWGKLCERIVHNMLGFEYEFHSNTTIVHPKHKEWAGSPDGSKGMQFVELFEKEGVYTFDGTKIKKCDTITDMKCPLTRKGFYNLIKHLYIFDGFDATPRKEVNGNEIIQLIRKDTKEGEKYYWQLVSNACITKAKYAELIVFMPYYEQLEEIKQYNESLEEPYWLVARAKDDELPYIYKESGIKNLNIIRFEVPIEDKIFLEQRVKLAIDKINETNSADDIT